MKRLVKKNADVMEIFESLIPILETDPMNTSLRHHIKKLEGVTQGDGQWRIRSGVYRFRYDVVATKSTSTQSIIVERLIERRLTGGGGTGCIGDAKNAADAALADHKKRWSAPR